MKVRGDDDEKCSNKMKEENLIGFLFFLFPFHEVS